MPSILFPTDFSEAADHAFVYALQLADKLQADITTVHAYEKPSIKGAAHNPASLERFAAEFDLYEFENYRDNVPHLDRIAAKHNLSHISLSHSMIEGSTKKVIIEEAERQAVDLIVMGTTGSSGLEAIFIGSIAGEVLENAHCPVLAVPIKSSFDGKIDKIALSLSYKEEEVKALDQLITIANPFGASIHCVHVDLAHTESHNKRIEVYKQRYAEHDNLHFHVLPGNDLKEAISTFVKEQQIDFLAMVSHKRNFLQELFNYSHAKSMSYHSEVPVMSFPF